MMKTIYGQARRTVPFRHEIFLVYIYSKFTPIQYDMTVSISMRSSIDG